MERVVEESDLMNEYFERIRGRLVKTFGVESRVAQAWFLARSGEDHFARFELPCRRYFKARDCNDITSAAYEKKVMLAILYEVADTSYLTLGILNPDELALESSSDGYGISGETAADIVKILGCLDNQCKRLIQIENKFGLRVNFASPVDEKEGLTFRTHRHWQDFVPGSVQESFSAYFSRARQMVSARLNQKPRFWAHQTVRQYLLSKGYRSLLEIAARLEKAYLKEAEHPKAVKSWSRPMSTLRHLGDILGAHH